MKRSWVKKRNLGKRNPARKTVGVVSATPIAEQAWFLGSTVMVASMLLHTWAKPYEDALIDWCEFLSLVSSLFIFQA